MTIRALRPADLDEAQLAAWRRLQSGDPELERPFFAPEYFRILGEIRRDIRIAAIERLGEPVGFFPFQQNSAKAGGPAGGKLNDFQGLISAPGLELDPLLLLRACGLSTYRFDHLLAHQAAFRRFHSSLCVSPYADVSGGYEAYIADRSAAGVNWVSQLKRKVRKLCREVGELRFVFDCRDPDVFERLMTWKSLQRERTATEDVLRLEWVRRFLARLLGTSEPSLKGRLSALYAGQRLVAAHFGILCHRSLHTWIPAYDTEVEKYSPGLIMFVELFRAAAEEGLRRVDLGKGRERYKLSMATGTSRVAEGCADVRPIGRLLNGAWYAGRRLIRESGVGERVRGPKRQLRKLACWLCRRPSWSRREAGGIDAGEGPAGTR